MLHLLRCQVNQTKQGKAFYELAVYIHTVSSLCSLPAVFSPFTVALLQQPDVTSPQLYCFPLTFCPETFFATAIRDASRNPINHSDTCANLEM